MSSGATYKKWTALKLASLGGGFFLNRHWRLRLEGRWARGQILRVFAGLRIEGELISKSD